MTVNIRTRPCWPLVFSLPLRKHFNCCCLDGNSKRFELSLVTPRLLLCVTVHSDQAEIARLLFSDTCHEVTAAFPLQNRHINLNCISPHLYTSGSMSVCLFIFLPLFCIVIIFSSWTSCCYVRTVSTCPTPGRRTGSVTPVWVWPHLLHQAHIHQHLSNSSNFLLYQSVSWLVGGATPFIKTTWNVSSWSMTQRDRLNCQRGGKKPGNNQLNNC